MILMMTYKDMTFCSQSTEGKCINRTCFKFFTEEDARNATRWWGSDDYPLAMSDLKSDKCGHIVANVIGEKL
jgi:hypothetical protein